MEARPLECQWEPEARESTRLVSTDLGSLPGPPERMDWRSELTAGTRGGADPGQAVIAQDVETVKVRHPLEAASSSEHGPSRGACLTDAEAIGAVCGSVSGPSESEPSVARPIRPCCAESSPSSYIRRPSGNFDSACRRSSFRVRAGHDVRSPASATLPSLPISRRLPRGPSPGIAISATFCQ
jgi:hypothetical protein